MMKMMKSVPLLLALAGCPDRWDPEHPPGVSGSQSSGGGEAPAGGAAAGPEAVEQGAPGEPVDRVVSGALADGDAVLAVDGTLYDAYTIDLVEGATLVVTMQSTEVDPYVHVIAPDGRQLAHGGRPPDTTGREAEVIVVAPADGAYQIYANAVEQTMRGAYELHVVAEPPPRPAPAPE